MGKAFENIRQGLAEAIEHAKGRERGVKVWHPHAAHQDRHVDHTAADAQQARHEPDATPLRIGQMTAIRR